jgi:diaminopimelate epimerase
MVRAHEGPGVAMNIEFVKMEGAGNDYIYLDLIQKGIDTDFSSLAKKISSRHFGVGGDGLVLILPSSNANYRMRMFNADGSEAEMCGNAIRCVGKYLFDYGYLNDGKFTVETPAGIKNLTIVETDGEGKVSQVQVDMGPPILSGKEIPVTFEMNPVVDVEVMGYRGTAVSMGNPHFVIFVDRITNRQIQVDGPKLEKTPVFPNRVNVEFVQVFNRENILVRVWERGSGETLACGTGACASVVASVLNKLTERKVKVNLTGGVLQIEWRENNNSVYLTGPAVEVFKGVYPLT